MNLIVSLDTEADNQWDHGRPLSTENVRCWSPFQQVCERYGIRPTYLITSEISADPRATAFLRPLMEAGRIEVGAHLHPWTTPPFRDEPGFRFNDPYHAYPSQLEESFLHDKLATLTRQITEAVGRAPTAYRAGRYGFNGASAEILRCLGYVVDSSVTPLMSWTDSEGLPGREGGPDFRAKPLHPYWIALSQGKRLLEIPVTILFTQPRLEQSPWLIPFYRILSKCTRRLPPQHRLAPQPLWLRPYRGITMEHLSAVWNEAQRRGLPAVVMMFHSSELMPGASPYRPTAESVRQLLGLLGEFFDFVRKRGGEGLTLTEAADRIARLPGLETQAL
jgi:hypothetical protein